MHAAVSQNRGIRLIREQRCRCGSWLQMIAEGDSLQKNRMTDGSLHRLIQRSIVGSLRYEYRCNSILLVRGGPTSDQSCVRGGSTW